MRFVRERTKGVTQPNHYFYIHVYTNAQKISTLWSNTDAATIGLFFFVAVSLNAD